MEKLQEIKLMLYIGSIIMVSLAFIIVSISLYYRSLLFKKQQIDAHKLVNNTIITEKKERERIARDLHDSVIGDLNSIRNYMTVLKKNNHDVASLETFNNITTGVENALTNINLISYNLMPPLLEKYGLSVALNDYWATIAIRNEIIINVDFKTDFNGLSRVQHYELFRVFQEFTNNFTKHGFPTIISIDAILTTDSIVMLIMDNGKHYDFMQQKEISSGIGLKNIDIRLKGLGATIYQKPTTNGNHICINLKNIICLK